MSAKEVIANNATDLVIIGGGVNGCGIARDAAGRGLSVILVEMDDLGVRLLLLLLNCSMVVLDTLNISVLDLSRRHLPSVKYYSDQCLY